MSFLSSQNIVAAVVGIIILMAVVIPIAQAGASLTDEPVYEEIEIGDGEYYMERVQGMLRGSTQITASDTASGVTWEGPITIPEGATLSWNLVIASDTAVVTFVNSSQWKAVINDGTSRALVASHEGDYITFSSDGWELKHYTNDRSAASEPTRSTEPAIELRGTPGTDANGEYTIYSNTYSWILYPNTSGKYVHVNAPTYVDDDAVIYTAGATYGADGRGVIVGTLDNLEVELYYYTNFTDPEANYTEGEYTNTLNSITVSAGGGTVTITEFAVPYHYTVGYEHSMSGSLVLMLPVLLCVALLMGIIWMAILRRREEE